VKHYGRYFEARPLFPFVDLIHKESDRCGCAFFICAESSSSDLLIPCPPCVIPEASKPKRFSRFWPLRLIFGTADNITAILNMAPNAEKDVESWNHKSY
jgi:hypothetical protein